MPSHGQLYISMSHIRILGILGSSGITLSHPSLIALLFPYLFIDGKDHYSMVIRDANGEIIPEERGGITSVRQSQTFAAYIKQQLLNVNRRFARYPSFLFWTFDVKGKSNIHSANRHTVRTGGKDLTKDDLLDVEGNYGYIKVTIVSHNVSSSYAYQQKHYLDLKAMCDNLGRFNYS